MYPKILVILAVIVSCTIAKVPNAFYRSKYARNSDDEVRSKIIGGEDIGKVVPYQISLQVKRRPGQRFHNADWAHNCGGSILQPTVILTAAHCVVR